MTKKQLEFYLKDVVKRFNDLSLGNGGAGKFEEEIALYLFKELRGNEDVHVSELWNISRELTEQISKKYLVISRDYK